MRLLPMMYDPPVSDVSRWQEELDRLAPRNNELSWLKIVWVPGDPWVLEGIDQRVNRWFIYQMFPMKRIPDTVLPSLLGPHPRKRGYYDKYLRAFVPDPDCTVDRIQWELFDETGCYGRPYWVVQGSRGGHKRRFDRQESVVSRMNGGPKDPPLPGDLPYAPVDQRVIDKLYAMDLVRVYNRFLDFTDRKRDQLDAEDEEVRKAMRQRVWGWLESQVSDAFNGERGVKQELMSNAADGDGYYEKKLEHLTA
jgi:hypothetical protein